MSPQEPPVAPRLREPQVARETRPPSRGAWQETSPRACHALLLPSPPSAVVARSPLRKVNMKIQSPPSMRPRWRPGLGRGAWTDRSRGGPGRGGRAPCARRDAHHNAHHHEGSALHPLGHFVTKKVSLRVVKRARTGHFISSAIGDRCGRTSHMDVTHEDADQHEARR